MASIHSGFISIYKPKYLSSTACVNRIKQILKIKKAGHSGTLDSLAQGVLVVAIGSSTRLLPYLQNCKSYESTFRFGQYSDSIDCETVIRIDDSPDLSYITPSLIQSHLKQFEGDILQQVPLYSAVKIHGQRSSDRARRGMRDLPKERVISIQSIQLSSFQSGVFPEATLKIDCKSGTYIRSLCKDLASSLHTKGIVTSLIRTQCHGLHAESTCTLDSLSILPELLPLSHLPICILPTESVFKSINTFHTDFKNIQILEFWDYKTVKSEGQLQTREVCIDDCKKDVLLASQNANGTLKIFGVGNIKSSLTKQSHVLITLSTSHLF